MLGGLEEIPAGQTDEELNNYDILLTREDNVLYPPEESGGHDWTV